MPLPICYLNGDYQALERARISPLDRGFLFGDAVYEVVPVYAGRPFRFREHFDRLARSIGSPRSPRKARPPSCVRVAIPSLTSFFAAGHTAVRTTLPKQ